MLLLPRMLQALDVLQLPHTALPELVENALAENEALAIEGGEPAAEKRSRRNRDRSRSSWTAPDAPSLDETLASMHEESLECWAKQQLADFRGTERVRALMEAVLSSLDESGYRTIPDDLWASAVEPPATPQECADADRCLAALDPTGVGARGPIEALLWHFPEGHPKRPLVSRILGDLAGELARNHKSSVARILDISMEDLERILAELARLAAPPSRGFTTERSIAIDPDIVVHKSERGFELELRLGSSVEVVIDREIEAQARSRKTPPELRRHLRERLEAARAFLDALSQRRWTLERVARAVFLRQPAFLESGPRFLRPLRMQDVADALSVHSSTVSRAVAGKYVESPWGIHRLRDFFAQAVASADGEAHTRDHLREAIQAEFAGEDKATPLGDEEVVERLTARGFQVARRTVAKYRAELGIPSSWRRRERTVAVGG